MDSEGTVSPSVRKEYPRSSRKTRKIAGFTASTTPPAVALPPQCAGMHKCRERAKDGPSFQWQKRFIVPQSSK